MFLDSFESFFAVLTGEARIWLTLRGVKGRIAVALAVHLVAAVVELQTR